MAFTNVGQSLMTGHMLYQLNWWVEIWVGIGQRFFKTGSCDIKLEACVINGQLKRKFARYELGEEWS